MNRKRLSSKEMVTKSKNKALSCSTPEHRLDSPSRDSDSICDSESASPVPFLCTQDGAEGETDVVWNYYTPKSETARSRFKNTTPVSRRTKRSIRSISIEKPLPRRRPVKPSQKNTELLQDLIELNQNLHEYMSKKQTITTVVSKPQSEEDIFSDTGDCSPRSGVKSKTRCLRKNVLSSKFSKAEPENGLESDDSMNECLIKASQIVEENILHLQVKPAKRPCLEQTKKYFQPGLSDNIDQDSMDAILSSIKIDSPSVTVIKKCDSPRLNNDSFDCLLGNINDSVLERLSQIPHKSDPRNKTSHTNESSWILKDVCNGSPSSMSVFGRHNSMPESPSVNNSNKPSTSGMAFGRYSSMPFNKSDDKSTVLGDSPIRCTPDEIKMKHKQAREKLLAKRQLPFTSTLQASPSFLQSQIQPLVEKISFQIDPTMLQSQNIQPVVQKSRFQLKVPSSKVNNYPEARTIQKTNSNVDIKLLIEKKRQEALMKLRKRQPQNR